MTGQHYVTPPGHYQLEVQDELRRLQEEVVVTGQAVRRAGSLPRYKDRGRQLQSEALPPDDFHQVTVKISAAVFVLANNCFLTSEIHYYGSSGNGRNSNGGSGAAGSHFLSSTQKWNHSNCVCELGKLLGGHIILTAPLQPPPQKVPIYWSNRAENAPTAVAICYVLAFTLWAPPEKVASLCGGNCWSRAKARGQRRVQQLGCGDGRLYFYLHFQFEAANEEQLVIGRLQVVFKLCHPTLAAVSLLAANQPERSRVLSPKYHL